MQKLLAALKDCFVAHPGNDHKPHFLRAKTILVVLLLAGLIEAAALMQSSPIVSRSGFLSEIISSLLTQETNQNRSESHLDTLATNPLLTAAAAAKAEDMAAKGYFAHVSPEGLTPWYWLDKAGYEYSYAGENLAVNFTDSKEVVDAWMNSPGHRANILNAHFKEIGIATANGTYEGKNVVFVVQMFGSPVMAGEVSVPAPAIAANNTLQPAATGTAPSPEIFAAVRGAEIEASASASGTLAKTDSSKPQASAWSSINDLSPSRAVSILLVAIALMLAATLIIKLTRVGFLHPGMIANGSVALLLIAAFTILNHYVFISGTKIL